MQPSRLDTSVTPKSLTGNPPRGKKPTPSIAKNDAKTAILAEWPQWAADHVIDRAPRDNDGHLSHGASGILFVSQQDKPSRNRVLLAPRGRIHRLLGPPESATLKGPHIRCGAPISIRRDAALLTRPAKDS